MRYIRIVVLILAAACANPVQPGRLLYREDFNGAPEADGWLRALTHQRQDSIPANAKKCFVSWAGQFSCEAPWVREGGTVATRSPWWVDRNSEAPAGAGTLLLMGWVRVNGEDGGPIVGPRPLNLRDAVLSARLRVDSLHLAGGSHIYFWFQTDDPVSKLRVNFVLLGNPVDVPARNGVWFDWTATLSPEANWQCLGGNAQRTDFYGCMDVGQALENVVYDFGFIGFPTFRPPAFPDDPNSVGTGVLRMDWFEIRAH